MQCANNFKQVALALHNYHAAVQSFPPGMMVDRGSPDCPGFPTNQPSVYMGWSWGSFILPQMEQQALYDSIDFESGGVFNVGAREALGVRVEAFVCPTDPNGGRWVECCSGFNNGPSATDDTRATNIAGVADSIEMYCGSARQVTGDADGMLFNFSPVRIGDVRDGTSNTLLIGEITGGMGTHSSQGAGYMSTDWGFWSVQDTELGINGPGTVPGGRDEALDPIDGDGGNRHDELYAEVGFSSFHPGGAQFALGDGSVHFLSENINQQVFEDLATRAGGEVVSADAF